MTAGCQSMGSVYTTGEAAALLGRPLWQVQRLLSLGRIPEVRMSGGRRLWTADDVERARQALAAEVRG